MDRRSALAWVEHYERLWREPGVGRLGELFAADATYRVSPWTTPLHGLEAIEELWEAERSGPDESFTMNSEIVAFDEPVAVIRVSVDYGRAPGERWRDLWVVRFDSQGRCAAFEEWPFAPSQRDGH